MARLFLINPLTDEPIRSPLLAFLYLAASLRRAGHEVELFDGSASNAPAGTPQLVERIRAFGPDVVGIHCKTLYALESYGLARELRELGVTAPFVCGGPHPTVVPLEPLAHGFEFSVRGEGEETLVELCDALDGKRQMSTVRSLVFRDTTGAIQLNEPRGFLLELDQLAKPADALDLFDPAWYGKSEPVPPAGLLSSRGCPAACTFCSNNVTGRRFRYRSPELIKEEIEHFARIAGLRAFAFFDDSFAVGRRRVEELCAVLKAMPEKPMWTCTAHPAHLHRDVMLMMKQAGCGGVDIGMESGDAEMLLRIGKGVTKDRVLEVLCSAKQIGLHAMLNLMFGWPGETDAELRATLDFMEAAAPFATAFNARGVLVPYPGTEIYDLHHRTYGFTDWWLKKPVRYQPFPMTWARGEVERAYAEDAALEHNFFRLPQSSLDLIKEGLAAKARHTFARVSAAYGNPKKLPAIPAAGAR